MSGYDYFTSTPPAQMTVSPQSFADMALLSAYLLTCRPTMREIRAATGLSDKRVDNAKRNLRDYGWHIECSSLGAAMARTYLLRPPGKQPCPECGHLMRSTNPAYQCEVCLGKRIAAGQGIWPWESEYAIVEETQEG